MVIEGIPQIPLHLVEEVGRYTESRRVGFYSWHPVLREMLIGTRFADVQQVHRVRFPGGDRYQLTFFPDRTAGASYDPKDGEHFVFSKDVGGKETFQFYRYDLNTGEVARLTDGKSRNTGGVWSQRGDAFAYGSTRRNGVDVDLWVTNPSKPDTNRMIATFQGGGWVALDWSPNDQKLLVSEEISVNENNLWLVDVVSGERGLITRKSAPDQVAYSRAQFSRDGKGVYATTDHDSEFQRLTYIDLATGRHTYLTNNIKWNVEGFRLSWDGKSIAFVTNEDGLSILHLRDVQLNRELPLPQIPTGIIVALGWHRNNRDLAFRLETSHSGADIYSLDVKTRKVERWTYSEIGGLNASSLVKPELIRWKSFDGRVISGFLYRAPPRFSGPRPVIINIHGGPEAQFRPGFVGETNYFINQLGISVIFPNVRGSAGYGKTFLRLDNGSFREGAYKDIGALLDWVNTRPDLDAERIMVTGTSYGGHMTLAAASYYSDRIRCALEVVGPSNLMTFLEKTAPYRRDLRRLEYGDEREPQMREFLNRTAPINNAARVKKPLFVVQGGNDPRVPVSESVDMVNAVRKNGTPVWYLMAKDEGHGFSKKRNTDFLLYSSVMFVKQYLLI